MKIKNIGHKIVSVGSVTIMPDEEKTFSGVLKDNPSLRAMAMRGYISITAESTDEEDIQKEEEVKEEVKSNPPTQQDIMFEQTPEFAVGHDPVAATTIRGRKSKANKEEDKPADGVTA